MNFKDAEELKIAILTSAERLENREVFDHLISLIRLSSFSIIPKNEVKKNASRGEKSKEEPLEGTAYIKVSTYGSYHVCFYESFIERYLKTEDDCLFIMLHELEHLRQGDHHRGDLTHDHQDHEILNIVADVLINSRLCQKFFPRGVPFFDAFYSPAQSLKKNNKKTIKVDKGVNLLSLPLIPPMILFKHFSAQYARARDTLGFSHLPEHFTSYDDYTIEQYHEYTLLIKEALKLILLQSCKGPCKDVIINIYVMGWFGKPTARKLFNAYQLLLSQDVPLCHMLFAPQESEEEQERARKGKKYRLSLSRRRRRKPLNGPMFKRISQERMNLSRSTYSTLSGNSAGSDDV